MYIKLTGGFILILPRNAYPLYKSLSHNLLASKIILGYLSVCGSELGPIAGRTV